MDLFTHVLIAYLISYGLWGTTGIQYIAAGALAGGLPDADALFFPLANRFPLLRHHGITHSIFGVTVIAAAGAFLVPPLFAAVIGPSFAAGSPLLYFLAMEAGGLSHVFLDGFTHFAVPPLAPFSKWELHLDADRAINLGTFAFTGFSFWLLLDERGRVPLAFWQWTSWALLAGYLGYLTVRGLARWRAEGARKAGGFTAVVPQGTPTRFLLVEERSDGVRMRLRSATYHLLGGRVDPGPSLELPITPPPAGPVADAEQALGASYAPSLKAGRVLAMTYHTASVRRFADHFLIFWYSLEFSMLGRAAGVIARVDTATGAVTTRTAWMSPRRFGA
jgi:membrane-bound metal-dependent hydrolase YbcI (DUF457 family)